MVEERAIYYPNVGYLEVHLNSEGMWDYTLYDTCLQEIDGGVIDNDNPFIGSAVGEICILHRLPHAKGQPLHYETFDIILESIKEVEPPW